MNKAFGTNISTPSDNLIFKDFYYKNLKGRQIVSKDSLKKNNVVLIYGHHSSLERVWGIITALSDYVNVYVPDLPGMGGMDNFYKINLLPTIDNYADFLNDYLNKNFKNKKIILIGISFGFVIMTRALQRHKALNRLVKSTVSIVGFSNYNEFGFSKIRYYFYYFGASMLDNKIMSFFFDRIILSNFVLSSFYSKTYNAKNKFNNSKIDFNQQINFEIELWHQNHVATWIHTAREFLRLDNTKITINQPLLHIYTKKDNFFNQNKVISNLKRIYTTVKCQQVNINNHSPSILADKKEAKSLIPDSLIEVLKT